MPFVGQNRPGHSFNKSTARFHTNPLPSSSQTTFHSPGFQGAHGGIRIKDHAIWEVVGTWFLFLIVAGFAVPASLHILETWRAGEMSFGTWALCLVPLLAFGAFRLAFYYTLKLRKYGRSELRINGALPTPGQTLSGAIYVTVEVKASSEYVFELQCTRSVTTGSGKNRTTRTETAHKATQKVPATGINSKEGIPFNFAIPSSASPSGRVGNVGIQWGLSVKAATPGVDYAASFPITIAAGTVTQEELDSELDHELDADHEHDEKS